MKVLCIILGKMYSDIVLTTEKNAWPSVYILIMGKVIKKNRTSYHVPETTDCANMS